MKKYFSGIIVITLLIVACKSEDDKPKVEDVRQSPLSQSGNTTAFDESFKALLSNYYLLKDNFIAENDTAVNSAAKKLIIAADSLKVNELKADTNIIANAKQYAQSISSEAKGLVGEKDIEAKRKSFNVLSNQLYDLIRNVQFNKETVYYQHCPMAFNEAGADWLSSSSEIKNPYLPKKMISCGEVRDSIIKK
jgi:uncharacterized protein YcfL